jgi:hypothetical protein
MKVKLTLVDLYGNNIIAYKDIFLYANLINAWTISNLGSKQEREMR